MNKIKLAIEYVGQPYKDEPVIVHPRATAMTWGIAAMFGRVFQWTDEKGHPHRELVGTPSILVRYNRIKLNWIKPA